MWLFLLMMCVTQELLSAKDPEPKRDKVNPEAYWNISSIIRHRGYDAEEYEVTTPDGYILTINRIASDRERLWDRMEKKVVLLQHGLALEGSNWVANMPNNSLGFMLADSGFDVWIGNNRGNSWSREHRTLKANQEEYSTYSFHEMAEHDLPTIIEFILQHTGKSHLHFVGFGQGATQGLIAFSSKPYLAKKINMFHALAPLSTLKNSKSPFVKLLFLPDGLIKTFLGKKDIAPKGEMKREFTNFVCSSNAFKRMCSWVLSVVGGCNEKNLNMSRIDVYVSRYPDSTSIQNLLHWGQIYKTGKFRQFDYGDENKIKYNQTEPPSYNLENMRVKTAVWYGEDDWIADPENVKALMCGINESIVYKKSIPKWTHFDFLWGLDAPQQVYNEIIELIKSYP